LRAYRSGFHVWEFAIKPAKPSLNRRVSPGHLFAEFRNVRGVMFPMPFVEKKKPIDVPFTVLRVHENARKMFRL
jgi:hypothetical protein